MKKLVVKLKCKAGSITPDRFIQKIETACGLESRQPSYTMFGATYWEYDINGDCSKLIDCANNICNELLNIDDVIEAFCSCKEE